MRITEGVTPQSACVEMLTKTTVAGPLSMNGVGPRSEKFGMSVERMRWNLTLIAVLSAGMRRSVTSGYAKLLAPQPEKVQTGPERAG